MWDPTFEFDRRDTAEEQSEQGRRRHEAGQEQAAIWQAIGQRLVCVIVRECAAVDDADVRVEQARAPFFK